MGRIIGSHCKGYPVNDLSGRIDEIYVRRDPSVLRHVGPHILYLYRCHRDIMILTAQISSDHNTVGTHIVPVLCTGIREHLSGIVNIFIIYPLIGRQSSVCFKIIPVISNKSPADGHVPCIIKIILFSAVIKPLTGTVLPFVIQESPH